MKCEKYPGMIDDLVEGDLDRQTASYVNSHISACRECKYYYDALISEREMYEQYFAIEPAGKLWTELQRKLKAAETKNTVKSVNIFARVFDRKLNIFTQIRLTPVVVCATLLFIFGTGFGLLNLLPNIKVSENPLISKPELRSNKAIDLDQVETDKGEREISHEKTAAFKNDFLQNKQEIGESRFTIKRITSDTKAQKTLVKEPNAAKQPAFAREKEISAKAVRLNEKELLRQLQLKKLASEPEGDFYSLPFAGIHDELKEKLQILRVDLPRSSLIALGVDLPAESGEASIKTDLLVSSDGVARAIRLLK